MNPAIHNPDPSRDLNRAALQRRVEITVEREVVSVIYQPASVISAHCDQCGADVPHVSPETAAAQTCTSNREIYRWIERNLLHFQELPGGAVLICSQSLKNAVARELP